MAKKYVFVIDTQYDFMMSDGILYVNGSEDLIVPMNKYLSSLKAEDTVGVVFTYDTHIKEEYEGSPESEMFPIHCEFGTRGWENVINPSIVSNGIETLSLRKNVFDMWEQEHSDVRFSDGTRAVFFDREEIVEDIVNNGITVTILGVALNFCVAQAVKGFVDRGIKVELVGDLTRGIDTGNGAGDTDPAIFFKDLVDAGKLTIV